MDEFSLDCGVRVELREFKQSMVYEGLLEGLPIRERNEGYLRDTLERVRRESHHVPVTLLPPKTRPIETEEPYPFGLPEAIPSVCCVGRFHSYACTSRNTDPDNDYSELVIVWFQDEFLLAKNAGLPAEVRKVDWDSLAGNFGD